MPIFQPSKAVAGGIKGITQIVSNLEGYAGDQDSKYEGTQSLFIFVDVEVERAGKVVAVKDSKLTEYVKEGDEPNSKWIKLCNAWIAFAVDQGWLEDKNDKRIEEGEEGFFKLFYNRRIRYSKVVLVEGNTEKGFSPGMGWVPIKLMGDDEKAEDVVYGLQATASSISKQREADAIKKEMSQEALDIVTNALEGEEDGLDKNQLKTVAMASTGSRATIIKVGGLDSVLDAAASMGLVIFNGDVYVLGSEPVDAADNEEADEPEVAVENAGDPEPV